MKLCEGGGGWWRDEGTFKQKQFSFILEDGNIKNKKNFVELIKMNVTFS